MGCAAINQRLKLAAESLSVTVLVSVRNVLRACPPTLGAGHTFGFFCHCGGNRELFGLEMQAFVESLRSRRVGDVSSGGGNEPLQTGDPQSPLQEEVTADVQTSANRIAFDCIIYKGDLRSVEPYVYCIIYKGDFSRGDPYVYYIFHIPYTKGI